MHAESIFREGSALFAGLKYRPQGRRCIDAHFHFAKKILQDAAKVRDFLSVHNYFISAFGLKIYESLPLELSASRLLHLHRQMSSMFVHQKYIPEALTSFQNIINLFTKVYFVNSNISYFIATFRIQNRRLRSMIPKKSPRIYSITAMFSDAVRTGSQRLCYSNKLQISIGRILLAGLSKRRRSSKKWIGMSNYKGHY